MAMDNHETYKQIFPKGTTIRKVKMSNAYTREKSSVLQLQTWY